MGQKIDKNSKKKSDSDVTCYGIYTPFIACVLCCTLLVLQLHKVVSGGGEGSGEK